MQFILFIISPILSLPAILSGIKNRKRGSLLLMSLFMGLFAYCTMPNQDLFRHFQHYEYFSSLNLQDITFFDFSLNGIEIYFFCIMGKLGIHFDYFRLFTLTVGFFLLSKIFVWKISHSSVQYANNEYFERYIIFLLFFDSFYTILGLRYGFALCLYVYGVFSLTEQGKKLKAFFFFILASLFHLSFLFLGAASVFLYYLGISKRNMIFLAIGAFAAMTYFLTCNFDILGSRQEWYASGSRVSSYANMTGWGLLGFVGPKLCALPFVFLLFKYNLSNSKWGKMSLSWLVLSIISITNAVFFYRIWWVFSALGIYLLLDCESINGKFASVKKFRYAGLLFLILNCIPFNSMFKQSDYYRLLEPVPVILHENYDINEILRKYPSAGDFV